MTVLQLKLFIKVPLLRAGITCLTGRLDTLRRVL